RAAQEVATVWARFDPEAALAEAEFAPAEMRQALLQTVSAEWARLDPSGFIRILPTADLEAISGGIQRVLAFNPAAVADGMEGSQAPLAMSLTRAALASLAQVDIEAAKARVAALPAGQEREQALQQV